ncbi:MAG: hypothetical protein KDA41_08720 [Planctomycetales bacterium]|nr:hypothetical protein [Planctomycetales bacterium]
MNTLRLSRLRAGAVSAMAIALGGCCFGGPTYDTVPVSGTLKYADGTNIEAEVANIQFVPSDLANAGTKAASGDVRPDGTFTLTTVNPGDGAFVGEYKVTVRVWKTYNGREPLIDSKYEDPGTTPLAAKVEDVSDNHFDFTVERAKPGR